MFKRFKQELLFIPIMIFVIELLRKVLLHFYPDTALFDRGSELETFLFRFWQITWITSGTWTLMWVVFPSAHKSLVTFYHEFDALPIEDRRKYSTRLFLVFFFALVLLLSGRASTRDRLVDTLHAQLNVRESTGHNDGSDVEKYLRFVGRAKGDAWCAAFASFNYAAVGVARPVNPMSAWAPSFSNPQYVIWSAKLAKVHKGKRPQKGDCFTLYYANLNRAGHVGFIVGESGGYYITIEGNTGLYGSREGCGVHKLKRDIQKIYTVSDLITAYETTHIRANSATGNFANTMLSKDYSGTKHLRGPPKGQQFCAERQYLVQRHVVQAPRRTEPTSWYCTGRWQLRSSNGYSLHRNVQIKSNCIGKERQAQRGLRVQGPGAASKNYEPLGECIQTCSGHQAIQKGNSPDEGDPVYPLVG